METILILRQVSSEPIMNEDQWLKAVEPDVLLKWLQKSKKNLASERKYRLFSCACCRLIWDKLSQQNRQGVEVAEAFADGLASEEEREQAWETDFDEPGYGAVSWALQMPDKFISRPATIALSSAGYAREVPLKNHAKLQVHLLRDILANPYHPVTVDPQWLTNNDSTARKLANEIYAKRNFNLLPILADALEDAGCTDESLLGHLRSKGPHVRGCWALDLLLGKA